MVHRLFMQASFLLYGVAFEQTEFRTIANERLVIAHNGRCVVLQKYDLVEAAQIFEIVRYDKNRRIELALA